MNGYLIPANAKKGTLIFNLFRPIDLIICATGIAVSLLSLVIVQSSQTSSEISTILAMVPGGITVVLVFPVPNYHNVLCAIQSIIRFYSERRNYIWRGWCFYERFKDDSKSKK